MTPEVMATLELAACAVNGCTRPAPRSAVIENGARLVTMCIPCQVYFVGGSEVAIGVESWKARLTRGPRGNVVLDISVREAGTAV